MQSLYSPNFPRRICFFIIVTMSTKFIKAILKQELNGFCDTSDAPYKFEEVGKLMAEQVFNTIAFRSSGTCVGGDGGRDGWFIASQTGIQYKIACFVGKETSVKRKIAEEIGENNNNYVFFCYNKEIKEKERVDLIKKYPNLIIVDSNNIIRAVSDSYKLQDFFGIPFQMRKVLLETVQKRNYFQDKEEIISKYITRKVNVFENDRITSIDYFNWAKDAGNRLKVLKASAGFGKSCMMQQLYCNLLHDEELALPPIYYEFGQYFHNYYENIVKMSIGESVSGFRPYDFYFIFDGLDQLPYDSARELIADVKDLVKMNANVFVLISVRSNEVDESIFTNDFEIASIAPLTDNDIRNIIRSHVSDENNVDFIIEKIKDFRFLDNAFCLSSLINYYEENHRTPYSLIDLYDYLLHKDLDLIKKNKTPFPHAIELGALYTVLSRHDVPNRFNLFKEKSENHLGFSHNNILEYQAAKVISLLPVEKIIQLVLKENILLPSLRNMVGFLLNILSSSSKSEDAIKFYELLEKMRKHPLNHDVLLRIESDKLSPDLAESILSEAVNYYIKHEYYDCPDSLYRFIGQNVEHNFKMLLNLLNKISTTDNTQENRLIYIIAYAVLYNQNSCPSCINDYFTNLFISKIKNNNYSGISNIAWLLKIINKQLKAFSKKEINEITDFVIAKDNDPELLMATFDILKNSVNNISNSCFEKLINKFFIVVQINEDFHCEESPLQIKNGYINKSSWIFNIIPFAELSELYLKRNPNEIWSFFRIYTDFLKTHGFVIFQVDILNKLLTAGLYNYFAVMHGELGGNIKILTDFIVLETSIYHYGEKTLFADYLLDEAGGMKILSIILAYVFHNRDIYGFDEILQLQKFPIFNNFKFYTEIKEVLGNKFDSFLDFLWGQGGIYNISNEICELLPEKIRLDICERNQANQKRLEEKKRKEENVQNSVHIAFKKKEFKNESKKIYELLVKRKCHVRTLEYLEDYSGYSFINQFLIDTIGDCIDKNKTYEEFISSWFESQSAHIVFYIAKYMKAHSLSYNVLTEKESNYIFDFIKNKICIMPLEDIKYGHLLLVRLMEEPELKEKLKPIVCFAYGDDIVKLIKVLNPMDSMDFLENYISRNVIIKYITQNFREILNTDIEKMIVFDYIVSVDFSGIQRLNLIENTKSILVDFIRDNIAKDVIIKNWEILDKLNINLEDIGIDLLAEHIEFEQNGIGIYHNTAWRILNYYYNKKVDTKSYDSVFSCLYKVFEQVEGDYKKKTVAEIYIKKKTDNAEINKWYLDYLKKTDSMVSARMFDKDFGISSFESINALNELFIVAYKHNDVKNEMIVRMILVSYAYILDEILKQDLKVSQIKIEELFSSLWLLWEKTQYIGVIIKYRELELKKATHVATEINFEDIAQLVDSVESI